jgi:hypothetical protein
VADPNGSGAGPAAFARRHPDVPKKPAGRAAEFVGRRAVLDRISKWLDEPAGQHPWLLVTGGPGTGKSALMAWLTGAGLAPSDPDAAAVRDRIVGLIDAVHFCDADGGRTAPSLDPSDFARCIAQQLSRRYPEYTAQLVQSFRLDLRINMNVGSAEQVVGPSFGDIHGVPPASVLNCVLQTLAYGNFSSVGAPHLILVDALDEAALWRDEPKIVELLAAISPEVRDNNVRLLMTSRPVPALIDRFPPDSRWDLIEDAGDDAGDVCAFALHRLQAMGHPDPASLAKRIEANSAGNFLYAKFVLDYLVGHPDQREQVEAELPQGLDDAYVLFLRREYGEPSSDVWTRQSRPLLGTIGTAREKLARSQVEWLLEDPERSPLEPGLVEQALPRCTQYLDGTPPDGPFGIYHHSFREFLFDNSRAKAFATEEFRWHKFVAERFGKTYGHDWDGCHDLYGLRYAPAHFYEAARLTSGPDRAELTRRVVSLVLSPGYQAAHAKRINEPIALQQDLERALRAAALNGEADAPILVLEAALGLTAYRRDQLRPDHVFALARAGDLAAAERRLDLFAAERHWQHAALMVCAWLAAGKASHEARALCDRLAKDPLPFEPLPLLSDRVNAALDGVPGPVASLPDGVPPYVADMIVGRMKGLDPQTDPSMIAEFTEAFQLQPEEQIDAEYLTSDEALASSGDAAPIFRAEREAPLLVAYARDCPIPGDTFVDDYIQLHAANNYELYRNRSLWGILKSILGHPDQEWASDHAAKLAGGALAGSSLHFCEALPLVLLGLQRRAGLPEADTGWDRMFQQALDEAKSLGMGRTDSDSWARHKRRLAILAEIDGCLFGGTMTEMLVDTALGLPYGFAGFQSPACLTLAEAIAIATPHRQSDIDAALESAVEAAHNVQDPVFCARTTSRVNAMRHDWWGAPGHPLPDLDPLAEAERLLVGTDAQRHLPLHVLGEDYLRRRDSPDSVQLRSEFRQASTAYQLADLVYQQPVTELLRLNRDVTTRADDFIPPGGRVRVPDPEYRPLVAARIAAEILRRVDLPADDRRRSLQRLVPVSAAHTTTLDLVLARLLLLVSPSAPADIERICAAYARFVLPTDNGDVAGFEAAFSGLLGPT